MEDEMIGDKRFTSEGIVNEISAIENFAAVCQEVYTRFPAVDGKKPAVKAQRLSDGRAIAKAPTYLLTFYSQVKLTKDRSMPYWVRVVVDQEGEILKMTASR